eukprot:gene2385-5331_t
MHEGPSRDGLADWGEHKEPREDVMCLWRAPSSPLAARREGSAHTHEQNRVQLVSHIYEQSAYSDSS